MLLFSLLLLLWDYRNKYYLLFILMMLGMSVAMTTLLVEISKISNYLVPANFIYGTLETKIYRLLNSFFRIPLSSVMTLRNTGIVMYLTAIVFFVFSFHNSIRHNMSEKSKKAAWPRYALLASYPVLFFVFYHPETAYALYVQHHMLQGASTPLLVRMLPALDMMMTSLALIYLAYPIVYLLRNYLKNSITFFSEQLVSLAVSLGLLNLIFFSMFFTGEFRPSAGNVFQYGFWRYQLSTQVPVLYTTFLPIIALVILAFVFFIVIRFHTDNLLNGFKARGIRRNLNALYSNVRNVMHSKKNLIFNIRILAQGAMENNGSAEGREQLQQILDICDANLSDITRTLNNIHNMNVRAMNHNFIDAIEGALLEQSNPENVVIEKHFQQDNIPLRFDLYQITEAIGNIIGNSLEALAASEQEHPKITLTVYTSNSWVYFSASDNGCGIPKRLLKKVFRPYVSTKNKKNSWGIGLSYVFSVVKAHYGHIRIRSRQGAYTTVELLLPRDR